MGKVTFFVRTRFLLCVCRKEHSIKLYYQEIASAFRLCERQTQRKQQEEYHPIVTSRYA